MPMIPRLLRPLRRVIGMAATVVMTTFSGNALTTQSGDTLQTIQETVNF